MGRCGIDSSESQKPRKTRRVSQPIEECEGQYSNKLRLLGYNYKINYDKMMRSKKGTAGLVQGGEEIHKPNQSPTRARLSREVKRVKPPLSS